MPRRHPVAEGFHALLAEGPVLLSGGFGTELLRRGVPTPLPRWSADALTKHPDAVRQLHADYVRAGARVITANTFRTDRRTFAAEGGRHARTLTSLAVRLAREGVAWAEPERPVLVAGSVAPLADCYRPQDVPDDGTLRVEHALRAGDLIAAGASLLIIETMNTIREALSALGAARAGNVPALVSFVCAPGARLLSGESIQEAARAVADTDALAICVNCCAPATATEALEALLESTSLPAGVYANGRGRPGVDQGWRFEGGASDRAYRKEARRWLGMGARLIGGCCGTSPRTIRKLARLLR